jgi:hypothetical protein
MSISAFVLALIFGPMMLYSSANPFLADNPPISAALTVLVQSGSHLFLLMRNSHVRAIEPAPLSAADYGLDPSMVYTIAMEEFSDGKWRLSDPNVASLTLALRRQDPLSLVLAISVKRKYSKDSAYL